MLYIASNVELPLLPWDGDDPGFHVTKLGDTEAAVKTNFKNEHVYYTGAYEGCGCGFQAGEFPGYEDEEIDLKLKSLSGLANYLDEQLNKGMEIELFMCWDGDQSQPTEHKRTISTESIPDRNFWFKEIEHLLVKSKG